MTDKPASRTGIEIALRVRQAHRRELIQTLEGLQQRMAENNPTCECVLYEDLAEANRYLWVEWWSGREECEAARSTDRFRALLGAIQVLGTLESVRTVERTSDDLHSGEEKHGMGMP